MHEAIVGRGHRAPEKPLSVGARIISVSPTIASHCTPPLRLNLRGVPAASQQMSELSVLSVHLGCGLQSLANRATVRLLRAG